MKILKFCSDQNYNHSEITHQSSIDLFILAKILHRLISLLFQQSTPVIECNFRVTKKPKNINQNKFRSKGKKYEKIFTK